jgi:microcin C transport system substrate-binding protein
MRVSRRQLLVAAGAAAVLPSGRLWAEAVPAVHGIAMHGDVRYPPDFTHFTYADPAAPKGGRLALAAIGTFDSLNPYILRGNPAAGLGLVSDSLTTQSQDEAFTEYGLLAETMEMPEDRSWVAFTLRPEARWHDGRPVTVEDVIFSLDILRSKGRPFYRAYYANVVAARAEGERRVRFEFDGDINRELPLIIGQLPILPKHYWEERRFEDSTLEPPLASGPYRVKSFEPGRRIVYERVADYWGADVPVNLGRYNYDEVSYEYYRDPNIALEALKAGNFDFRIENSSRFWATGYTGRAVENGLIVREELPQEGGGGMQAFAFNIRRPIFQDRRVREALGYAFDFEWTNKTLFYGLYSRTRSYFENTELNAEGLPSAAELALLDPYRDRLPPEVFGPAWEPPATDGSGNNRENLRKAVALLTEAGWEIRQGRLVNVASGEPMQFEIMLDQGGLFERITGPFVETLKRLGVTATMRLVDDAQYQRRLDEFDFDMVTAVWGQSLSPGNEQRDFWGSAAARSSGSRNLVGIEDPIVDALIEKIVRAPDREALIAACRALDRVLMAGFYVIPQWYSGVTRIAYWDKLGRPATLPRYGLDLFAWWVDPARQAALIERARALGIRVTVAS